MSQTNIYSSSDEQELMFDSNGHLETDECRSTSPAASTPSIPESLGDLSGLDSDTEPRSVSVTLLNSGVLRGGEDSLSDDSDEEREHRDEEDESSSSSSESEAGTQIWVPPAVKKPLIASGGTSTPTSQQLTSSNASLPCSNVSSASRHRNTLVTQNHMSGKPETELLPTISPLSDTGEELSVSSIDSDHNRTRTNTMRPITNNGPTTVMVQPQKPQPMPAIDIPAMNRDKSASLFSILSGLYAIFVIILGAVFPIAEMFSRPVKYNFFEGFYLYLYGVGVLFLAYVYTYLLSNKTCCSPGPSPERRRFLSKQPVSKVTLDQSGQHTGSFYLRLGAIGFGVGSMIHDGLLFGEYFDKPCVNSALLGVRPMMHLVFTFCQMYFIFFNSKMCIYKYHILARFGLMHMFAANICVWLRNVVKETDRHLTTLYPVNPDIVLSQNATNSSLDCEIRNIMHNIVNQASPYLYPCTVCYSLIAAGILYITWRDIGKTVSNTVDNTRQKLTGQLLRGDCQGTNRGLFVGIFVLVAAIVTMIVFFVLVEKPDYVHIAIVLAHITEITIYSLAAIACLAAILRMLRLFFYRKRDITLEQVLLLISVTGVYVHAIFSIVAGLYSMDIAAGALIFVSGFLIIIESSIQTMFIVFGLHLWRHPSQQDIGKPGRQFVTFLLVCNAAMWGMDTFSSLRSQANPIQLTFYGNLIWTLILQISLPLCIFYHFHSTVCLSMIWKNAYKSRPCSSHQLAYA